MPGRQITKTIECFVEKDGKYLMLKRHASKRILPNVWIAPGGHQEFCEGLIAATRREIGEETGLRIRDIRLRVVGTAHLQDINEEFAFHILTAKYAGGKLVGNPSDGELVWLTPSEMVQLDNVLAELKNVIPLILSGDEKLYSIRVVYSRGNEMTEFEIEDPD